jgi:hypothetical protein
MVRGVLATMVLTLGSFGSSPQSAKSPGDALVDALVWGTYEGIDLKAYAPDVRTELDKARQHSQAYQSQRQRPVNSPEQEMLYGALVRYERLLVAFADDPKAQVRAVEYVDRLRPCYEWEGYHDCPEREASFAIEYLAANRRGPFAEYLPLLAAHRWLCTAEGYEYEKRPKDAARSRRAYEQAISTARRSTAPLVRTAAEALEARARCHSQG